MRESKYIGFLLALSFLPVPARPQTAAPVRDPNALALASRALQALAGSTALSDISLSASAAFTAGSDQETGSATLIALGNQASLVTLNLTNGERQEVRNGQSGSRTGPTGQAVPMALHNCWIDAAWFYPGLSLQALASDPTLGVLYLGPAQWNGVATVHLRFFHLVPGQIANVTSEIQGFSTIDFYFDPKSLLILGIDFVAHPDTNAMVNIPEEIRYSNYAMVSGFEVPFQIQKYVQGSLSLALTVTQATVNSGVPPTTFAAAVTTNGGAQ